VQEFHEFQHKIAAFVKITTIHSNQTSLRQVLKFTALVIVHDF